MVEEITDEQISSWLKHSVTTRDADKNLIPNRQEDLDLLHQFINDLPQWMKVVVVLSGTKIKLCDFKKIDKDRPNLTTWGDIVYGDELDYAISIYEWNTRTIYHKLNTFWHEVGHRLHREVQTNDKLEQLQNAAKQQYDEDRESAPISPYIDELRAKLVAHIQLYPQVKWGVEYFAELIREYLSKIDNSQQPSSEADVVEREASELMRAAFPIVWEVMEKEFLAQLKEFSDVDKFRNQHEKGRTR